MSASTTRTPHRAIKQPNGVRPHARPWSEAENQILRDGRAQVPPIGYSALARKLGRGDGPVYEQCARLGLTPQMHVPRTARVRGERRKVQNLGGPGFRACMGCERQFRSPDPHLIRMCDPCKRSPAHGLPDTW